MAFCKIGQEKGLWNNMEQKTSRVLSTWCSRIPSLGKTLYSDLHGQALDPGRPITSSKPRPEEQLWRSLMATMLAADPYHGIVPGSGQLKADVSQVTRNPTKRGDSARLRWDCLYYLTIQKTIKGYLFMWLRFFFLILHGCFKNKEKNIF